MSGTGNVVSPATAPEDTVVVTVRMVGPGRPTTLTLPPSLTVRELRHIVAGDGKLPVDRLKLILRGRTLGHDGEVCLSNGDTLIVAVVPKPPAGHLREDDDDDDDDDEQLDNIPRTASSWKRRAFMILHEKLKLPGFLLVPIFSLSLKAWACIILWFVLAPVAQRWDLGPLYIIGTGFLLIFLNLGKRQQGDVSAYSIFNEGFQELPGTLNADRIDRDIRAGLF